MNEDTQGNTTFISSRNTATRITMVINHFTGGVPGSLLHKYEYIS